MTREVYGDSNENLKIQSSSSIFLQTKSNGATAIGVLFSTAAFEID
jgi:hypothetical protein